MGYLAILFLLIVGIVSFFTGTTPLNNLARQGQDSISALLSPKTEKEILIDNIEKRSTILDRFFSSTAPSITKSGALTQEQKSSVQEAQTAFEESQVFLQALGQEIKDEKSIPRTIVEKLLTSKNTPTPSPAQCPQ